MDLTYIVMDNQIYGLTKGQLSPTSPARAADRHLYGSLEEPVNPLLYVLAYGAGFVAQGDAGRHGRAVGGDRRGHPVPGLLLRQHAVALRHLRRRRSAAQGAQSDHAVAAKLGHDSTTSCGDGPRAVPTEELYTGVFYRNPNPPPTYESQVKMRQADQAKHARPRARVLDAWLQQA
jgi:2-oxoglutarate ferredoxin oxidoreductase subunit beta